MYQINPFWSNLDFGTLVVELLFNDGAGSTTAVNTGSTGGTFNVGGQASISEANSKEGLSSMFHANIANPLFGAASGTNETEYIIGTANFRMMISVYTTTFTSTWGNVFWGWGNGSPQPTLSIAPTTGNLWAAIGGVSNDTGVVVDLNVWNDYELRRFNGVTEVVYNGSVVFSLADTADYNAGFSSGSLRVGSAGNTAGGNRNGYTDVFRFYNGNA